MVGLGLGCNILENNMKLVVILIKGEERVFIKSAKRKGMFSNGSKNVSSCRHVELKVL